MVILLEIYIGSVRLSSIFEKLRNDDFVKLKQNQTPVAFLRTQNSVFLPLHEIAVHILICDYLELFIVSHLTQIHQPFSIVSRKINQTWTYENRKLLLVRTGDIELSREQIHQQILTILFFVLNVKIILDTFIKEKVTWFANK